MSYSTLNQIITKTTKNNQTYNYTYDKNENILSDGDKSYTYTSFNKVKTITKEEFKHTLYANNKPVVVHTKTLIDNTKQVDKTAYTHKDSLGSIDTVTNSQNYNRYAYVWNNQLKYTDPTGYEVGDEDFGGGIGSSSGEHGYDGGAASDNQAEENDNQGGYNSNNDGGYTNSNPVSVFNPPTLAPTVPAPKEYMQTTTVNTSLSDSYFGGRLNDTTGDDVSGGGFWSGVKDFFKTSTWNRPKNHSYVVGRVGVKGFEPGKGITGFIDDHVPAGHTFGTIHDVFIDNIETGI